MQANNNTAVDFTKPCRIVTGPGSFAPVKGDVRDRNVVSITDDGEDTLPLKVIASDGRTLYTQRDGLFRSYDDAPPVLQMLGVGGSADEQFVAQIVNVDDEDAIDPPELVNFNS